MLKIIKITMILTVLFAAQVFAASQDWRGEFDMVDVNGVIDGDAVFHSPNFVYLFGQLSSTQICFNQGDVFELNSLSRHFKYVASSSGCLAVNMNADEFVRQISKIGQIYGSSIQLGASYSKQPFWSNV